MVSTQVNVSEPVVRFPERDGQGRPLEGVDRLDRAVLSKKAKGAGQRIR